MPIFPCGFFVLKKKKEGSPKIDLGLACQWVLKHFFPLTLVTQVAWQEEKREERTGENRTHKRQDDQRGENSLSGVFGERIVGSLGGSIPGAWREQGAETSVQSPGIRGLWVIQAGAERPLSGLASF